MSAFEGITQITGLETGPEFHNAKIRLVEAASHARSVLGPRAANNPLISGFSGGGGFGHLNGMQRDVAQGKGKMAVIADDPQAHEAGIVTVFTPRDILKSNGEVAAHGLIVDAFYVGRSRKDKLVELYKRGIELGKTMLGTTIEIPQEPTLRGRKRPDIVVSIPETMPLLALEVSTDFENTNRRRLGSFLGSGNDIESIRAIRTEVNDAIIEAGFEFDVEADLTRVDYPKTHLPGRYSLYQKVV